ncbi:hypothetical protein B0A49_06908 [Cryomyces minteri]|uniref:DNA damage-binding protein 1 n=1 Tax=Cryomyces minteri TaxID=331657 RepID=A0A4U0WSF8_9PEZI|nr:hypothetical protein B0A49_06908 [Cryomyces minteri]
MAYLAPIHRPSSVRHALKLKFLGAGEESLVVAKANRIEIYAQTPEGLALRHSKAIYGKVTILQKLRPASSSTDHLFVGTDRYTYFTLSWNAEAKQLRTEQSFVDLADKTARDSQTGDRCHIDPSGRFMTLELYEGVVTVVPIAQKTKKKSDVEIGSLGEPVPSRIPELFVRSSTYLRRRSQEKDKPRLALLYEDSHGQARLKLRELEYSSIEGSAELGDVEDAPNHDMELGASHIIPISAPAYGLLVLGETSIAYLNDSTGDIQRQVLEDPTIFVAWEQIDEQRFVLADDYGVLYLLMLILDRNNTVEEWKLDVIGETSRASVLVYLDGGRMFVGSHQGDSQVIQITEQGIEVIQNFPNIAPILDFTIMDMGSRSGEGQTNEYSSGQARIVTGSGAYKDGSLRSVRSGVGLENLGVLGEMRHVSDMFSLKSTPSEDYVDTLIVSFVDETRAFHFNPDGEVEEVEEYKGLVLSENTLLASNLPSGRLIQVTSSSVRLIDLENGMVVSEWTPPERLSITAAAANDQYIILSVGGVLLIVLDTKSEIRVHSQKEFGANYQVACVALPSMIDRICIVGFWQNSAVSVLSLDTLESVHTETVSDEGLTVPRSILLASILEGQPPTLFVAMADGNVFTFSFDPTKYTLSGKKSIVLGTQQANFRALPRGDGLYNVFATCEHPSLIYGSEGRIVYSAITADKASCVCPFNSEAYPDAIAIAVPDNLSIALVDTERTTHVQTLAVHETVRRIAYSPTLRSFGLGTIKRTLRNGYEQIQSHFKLADEVLFKELDTYALNQDELVESVIRAELDDGTGALAERFVVGTAYMDDEHAETVRGRILIFEVTEERVLKLLLEHSVKGACRCLAMVEGKIAAALIKTVVIYDFHYETAGSPFLTKKASYRTSTAPIDVAVTGNQIAIADLMKSVSIVQYTRGKAGAEDSLEEIAMHFQTAWGTAVAHVADNTFLESDAEGNLLVLHQDINGVTDDDRRRLQVTSEMLLGEMVNRIRRIDVQTTPAAVVVPRAFLATVEGSLYLFALIAPGKQDLLMRLQASMAELVKSPGDVPFNKYRAFKNQVREAEEPMRFVDGEFVERFLDCSAEVQEKVVEGLGMDVEDVRGMVEGLRRLH